MMDLSFNWQIEEFMVYCHTQQLREKTLTSYEQTLRLFERWCAEEFNITTVDKVNESIILRYIMSLQERGKYSFYVNDKKKETNFPDRRRDFRKPITATTINNYIRNLRVFFNWLDRDYVIAKNPMARIRQLKNDSPTCSGMFRFAVNKKKLCSGTLHSNFFSYKNHLYSLGQLKIFQVFIGLKLDQNF